MAKGFREYVSLERALSIMRRHVKASPAKEAVPVGTALGRVLFEDVIARVDIPVRDSSHMDGFAVRASDTTVASRGHPVSLRLSGGSALGEAPRSPLKKGCAAPILTGGFLPRGADAVVPVEDATRHGRQITVSAPSERGSFVFPKGRDVRRGEAVLGGGRAVRGQDLALLASLHLERVPVCRRPRVAIIPTGSELTEQIKDTEPGKVVESHTFILSALVKGAGGEPVKFPIAPDDAAAIERSIRAATLDADIVLTMAGSSVGEPDLAEAAIDRAGRPGTLVHGVMVHRGRVMGFGCVGGKAVVILPGPVQAAVNAFALLAYPLIRSFLGRGFEQPPAVPATIDSDWEAGSRFRDFAKVVYVGLRSGKEALLAEPESGETERMTFLTSKDGYLLLDGEKTRLAKGERVSVHLLPGLSSAWPGFG